ncbi:MAG: 2-C-methyl-D-erythritol 4-phosphate cytidylyltransferase [Planctomycetota bacterium]
MSSSLFVSAILLAAGRSLRMGADRPRKPLLELAGRTVLELCVAAFAATECVRELVVVVHADDRTRVQDLLAGTPFASLVRAVIAGGEERTDSVRLGVAEISAETAVILVHDVVRPFVRPERIAAVAQMAADRGAALLAVPVSDTIKTSRDGREVSGTLDRSILWSAQTPQGFDAQRLRRVLARAHRDNFTPTDDAALFERYEGAVTLVEGDRDNIKLTTPTDLVLGEAILRAREEALE